MNYSNVYLTTLIPALPKILNDNNASFKRYLDVIYNESTGVVVVPISTTGRVKASTGEFVTTITDNLIVKKQWTNLYANTTTIDADYYYAYIGLDASTRIANSMQSDASIMENSKFKYIDIISPYYKIKNDASIAFKCTTLGQEFQILFDVSTTSPYHILLDPSTNGKYKILNITAADASNAWVKLIAVEYDASWGTTWAVKQYGGICSII